MNAIVGGAQFKITVNSTGIRLLGERSTTDIQEAMALSHLNVIIDIYSNSWGPSDNGNIVDGPGRLTQMALEQAVRQVSNIPINWFYLLLLLIVYLGI